jgi:hypothetical protein
MIVFINIKEPPFRFLIVQFLREICPLKKGPQKWPKYYGHNWNPVKDYSPVRQLQQGEPYHLTTHSLSMEYCISNE